MDSLLDCQTYRRAGVEIELNTPTGVVVRPDVDSGQIMPGTDHASLLVKRATNQRVVLSGWDYIHNNSEWVVKHDMSCGVELNSPVFKGWKGLSSILKVIDSISKDTVLKADTRCSLHVHVDIGDLSPSQLGSVIAYYMKCEHVFFDSVPPHRKNNRYCPMMGMMDKFSTKSELDAYELVDVISRSKYQSINAYHFVKGGGFGNFNSRRRTLEFRIAENTACVDPFLAKCWIRLLLHFVDITKSQPMPSRYRQGDPFTGLLWLNPTDVFRVLRFNESLSMGLRQVRQWFIKRILEFGFDTGLSGIWSNAGRKAARDEFLKMIEKLPDDNALVNDGDRVFGNNYII